MPKGNPRPLRDEIADAVRAKILSGEHPPGTRLREEQIATAYAVSRVPVREALQVLAAQQFITLRPRRSAVVTARSPVVAAELLAVRTELEGMAARLAAARSGGEHAQALLDSVTAGQEAVRDGAAEELPGLVHDFHELVAEAAGNTELAELLRGLRRRVDWLFAVDLMERATDAWEDHRQLCEAILAGRTDRAEALMKAHVGRDTAVYEALDPTVSAAKP